VLHYAATCSIKEGFFVTVRDKASDRQRRAFTVIPTVLYAWAQVYGARNGLSMSAVLRMALTRFAEASQGQEQGHGAITQNHRNER